jgi:hypothetical protein
VRVLGAGVVVRDLEDDAAHVVVLVEQQLTHLSALHDLGPMLRFFKYFRKKNGEKNCIL